MSTVLFCFISVLFNLINLDLWCVYVCGFGNNVKINAKKALLNWERELTWYFDCLFNKWIFFIFIFFKKHHRKKGAFSPVRKRTGAQALFDVCVHVPAIQSHYGKRQWNGGALRPAAGSWPVTVTIPMQRQLCIRRGRCLCVCVAPLWMENIQRANPH